MPLQLESRNLLSMNNLKKPNKNRLYIDASRGIAGDMLLAALIDLGVPAEEVTEPLNQALPSHSLEFLSEMRRGIGACRATVESGEKSPPHRRLSDLLAALDHPSIPDPVKNSAASVYRHLAEAEAKVHQSTVDDVHFHEVGALDAQVDIIGILLAVHWLDPVEIIASAPALGSGFVEAAHGTIPIPAPAVVELLRGVPVCSGPAGRELTTPTGAAVLTTIAHRYCHAPEGKPIAQGWGVGTRVAPPEDPPNMVRVMLLEAAQETTETVAVLETHFDHLSGEEAGGIIDSLMESGALDAVLVPAWMKKSRPAQLLTVIARPEDRERLIREIHLLTGTLGVREQIQERSVLQRQEQQIEVSGERIRIKKAWLGDQLVSIRPEQDDLRAAAQKLDISLSEMRRKIEVELEKAGQSQ
ncbi:MAG: nickel pincer cofactor biosynthesis protein LarC [Planctomycetota bacterium]|nr:nickel pincer cofactor biosynthesis protein LarC [Planctomycetota bacterium]